MRVWWVLFGMSLGAVLASASFAIGFELGLARGSAMADPGLAALVQERDAATAELAALREEVSKVRQESLVLERSRQIERETNKALHAQLKDAQDERLALVKEGTYLKRLIRDGGKGAVRVHDLVLAPGKGPRSTHYSFTVTQLIPDSGETKGRVTLQVGGMEDGEARELTLDQLSPAEPKSLAMSFDHFQTFDGELTLPNGFEPRSLTILISPEGDRLASTSETFTWNQFAH
jgi:Family of unknown function (DUF6776)